METTSAMGLPLIGLQQLKVPRIKVPKGSKSSTVMVTISEDFTTSPNNITLYKGPDYSDEQFYTDLRKAGKRFDALAEKALSDHAQGKTEKFPEGD